MKAFGALLFAIAVLIPAVAQEAKVIIIEKSDAAELKAAYGEYKTALAHWEKVKVEVAKRYTTEHGQIMSGWDRVEFSVDFRALVPEGVRISGAAGTVFNYPCPWSGNTITTSSTPSAGTRSDYVVRLGR